MNILFKTIAILVSSTFFVDAFKNSILPSIIDKNNLFLVFPGLNGADSNIDMLIKNVKKSDLDNKLDRMCHVCEWSEDNNIFCAGDKALSAANRVTQEIVEKNNFEKLNLHLVGISAGALAASELSVFLKDFDKDKYKIHLTLLDPFTLFRFNKDYGIYEFGKRADFCEQYLNNNDLVPFTNKPIKNAYINDITLAESKKSFMIHKKDNESGHDWPLYYYANNWFEKTDPRKFIAVHDVLKRGYVRYIYS